MDERARMKAWRMHLGYSIAEWSKALGVVFSTAYMWETDGYTNIPSRKSILKACELAGISHARFLGALPRGRRKKVA